MNSLLRRTAIFVLAASPACFAQDSAFKPQNQQIPVPECLTAKGLWEGGSKPCSQNEHDAWLADISH